MAPITFHYCWQWALQSDIASLWPLVTNTDRFRAATAFPVSTYSEEPLAEGGSRRVGHLRKYGFPIVWEEEPFQWVINQECTEIHHYRVGPIKEFKLSIRLEPRDAGGTLLTYEVWMQPGNLLGYPGIPIEVGLLSRRRFGNAFLQMDEFLQKKVTFPFEVTHTPINASGRARLRDVATRLNMARQDPAIVSRLISHLEKAPDDQLTRMRPFELADEWGIDRYKALAVFLRATREGILNLSWDLLCPDCRGAKHRAPSLDGITRYAHCPSCNIDYEVDFARSVEATFQVNPSIRPVTRTEFCIGAPSNTPHVLVQQRLQPGETRSIQVLLESGRYRWMAPNMMASIKDPRTPQSSLAGARGQRILTVKPGAAATQSSVDLAAEMETLNDEMDHGMCHFMLTNNSEQPQLLLLSRVDWSDQSVTAAEITSLQLFRELFSSEALRPGESINVESLTILFTDLKGSTAMYRTFGDASVFRRVMDHFDILRDGVAAHHGAMVKTIGDAIMASFTDPTDAVSAAIEIMDGIGRYNRDNPGAPLVLKMGIHKGACIAVTLNNRLDYFGSIVNLAARLESQSNGDDLILSDEMAADPGVQVLLDQQMVESERYSTTLKGFPEPVMVHRLRFMEHEPVGASGTDALLNPKALE